MIEIFLGPPGTGKTTQLINCVESALTRGVPPDRVGYFSFTVKAATEAVERACKKFSLERRDFPHFSTLHSMCFRRLGLKRSDVLTGEKLREFARYAGVELTGKMSEDGTVSGYSVGDRLMFMENLSRIREIPLERLHNADDDGLNRSQLVLFSKKLAEFKRAYHLMDFTDMLLEFLRSDLRLGLRELYVDESQDLSHLQWRVVESLAVGCERVAVAGDDDQAIYRWAGADVDHLIDMTGDVRVLGQSYRVPVRIQDVANKIIGRVKHRRHKEWSPRKGADGAVEKALSFDRVNCDAGQILILARNAYVLNEQVEPMLKKQGIVFRRLPFNNWSINQKTLHAIQDWERLRRGEKIAVAAVRRIYGLMTLERGVRRGFKTLPKLEDDSVVDLGWLRKSGGLLREDPWHEALDLIPAHDRNHIRAARQRGEKISQVPRVTLSTIHSAKGGEADHVIVMKEMASRTFAEMQKNPEDEMRVWYVATTRAREKLTIVEPQRDSARRSLWL